MGLDFFALKSWKKEEKTNLFLEVASGMSWVERLVSLSSSGFGFGERE